MTKDPRRKTILISGVSSGIGLATARATLGRGYRVCGISRSAPDLDGIEWRAADVRDPNQIDAALAELISDEDRLEGVLCGAGFGLIGAVEDCGPDVCADIFATNYHGTVNLIRACLPLLRAGGGGQISILGSLSGQTPLPFQAHYSASKAAVESMALALSSEAARFGISVTLLALGDIRTEFLQRCQVVAPEWSAYFAALRSCRGTIESDMAQAPETDAVIELVLRSLTRPSRKPRRIFGRHALSVELGRRMLPVRLAQLLIWRHFVPDGREGHSP